jgi:Putative zinc-finger
MTPCPTDEEMVRLVDGDLAAETVERLRRHLAECSRCFDNEARLLALVADLRAPVAATFDLRAHTRAVMARLDQEPSGRRASARAPVWAYASAAVCATAVVCASTRPWSTHGTVQSRGGGAGPSVARDIRVVPCVVEDAVRPMSNGAVMHGDAALTATLRNIGKTPAYLLLFAVDARHEVHWISPPYARTDDDPAATTIPVSSRDDVLAATAVLEDLAPGPLRIEAVVSPVPTHVSDVESLGADVVDRDRLAGRLPMGTDIRETQVVVDTASAEDDR